MEVINREIQSFLCLDIYSFLRERREEGWPAVFLVWRRGVVFHPPLHSEKDSDALIEIKRVRRKEKGDFISQQSEPKWREVKTPM